MDFLRRLQPGHADAMGAARLDLAPRWQAAAEAQVAAMEAPVAEPRPLPASTAAHAIAAPTEHAIPGTNPAPRAAAVRADRAATPTREQKATVSRPALDALQARRQLVVAEPVLAAAALARPAALAAPALNRPATAGGPTVLHEASAPAAPQRAVPAPARVVVGKPLRTGTVQEAMRPAAADAAPIVHVTIDRIDVRLPPPASAPAAATRKPRAASGVASLSDYLRGRSTP